jgi:hypothetical protein
LLYGTVHRAEGMEQIGLPYTVCSYEHVQGGIQSVPGKSVEGEKVLDVNPIKYCGPKISDSEAARNKIDCRP